jgi:hypothetical protein
MNPKANLMVVNFGVGYIYVRPLKVRLDGCRNRMILSPLSSFLNVPHDALQSFLVSNAKADFASDRIICNCYGKMKCGVYCSSCSKIMDI